MADQPVGSVSLLVEADTKVFERQIQDDLSRRVEKEGVKAGKAYSEGIGRGMDDAAESTSRAKEEINDLYENTKAAGAAVGGVAALFNRTWLPAIKRFSKSLGFAAEQLLDFTGIGLVGISKGLRRVDEELEDNSVMWKLVGDAAGATATMLEKTADVLFKISAVITGAKIALGALVAAFGYTAYRINKEFTPAWNSVLTLIPEGTAGIGQLRTEVNRLAGDLGVSGPEAAATFYQILSALPELAGRPREALDLLTVSLEAGATGFTDAATAADAITSILNAFNLEATEARRVSDALFAAQDEGKLVFGEVAASIGRVAGIASTLGVQLEELLGVAAFLSKTGLDVSEGFTQMRAALNNILKPSSEAQKAAAELGLEFNSTALEAKGFGRFIREVLEATEGDVSQLARLFTSEEALGFLVTVQDDMEGFAEVVRKVGDSAGSSAAKFDQMNQSAERQAEIIKQELAAEMRVLGGELEKVAVIGFKVFDALIDAAQGFGRTITDLKAKTDGLGRAINDWLTGNASPAEARRQLDEFNQEYARLATQHISENAIEGMEELAEKIRDAREDLEEGSEEWDRYGDVLDVVAKKAKTLAEQLKEGLGAAANPAALREMALGNYPWLEPEPQPIARPATPTSLEFSQQLIDQKQAAGQVRAVNEYKQTQSAERYQEVIEETQRAVNDLILSEMERLRVAGVEEGVLAQLASQYKILTEEIDKEREARERAKASLMEGLGERVAALTSDATELALAELDKLWETFVETFGEDIPEAAREGFEKLRENIAQVDLLEGFREQFQDIDTDTIGAREALVGLFHSLREETEALPENLQLREQYVELLDQIADKIDQIDQGRHRERLTDQQIAEQQQRAAEQRLRDLREQARTIEESARAALQLAAAFGIVDDAVTAALMQVVQLGTSIARLAAGDLTAIPSAVGAAASLISGLFSDEKSPEEQERLRVMEENTRRVQELTQGIGELSDSLRGVTGEDILGVRTAAENALVGNISNRYTWEAFEKELERLGITMAEAEAVAAAYGITLNETDEALEALVQAIYQADIARLFESFGGQLELLQIQFDNLDIEDPIEQLEMLLAVFKDFSGLEVPEFDLGTEAGRAAAEAWVEEMTRAFLNGELGLEEMGGMSLDQFLQFLADFERRLEDAEGGVIGGTESTRLSVNITQAQANHLISLDVTRNRHLVRIIELLGGGLTAPGTSGTVAAGDVYITLENGAVQVPITASGPLTPEVGRQAGEAAGEALARRLGASWRANGGHGAPRIEQNRS